MKIELINQLLCSGVKVDRRYKNYGTANIFHLSVLSMIYKLIDLNPEINYDYLRKLQSIAQSMISKSEDICNIRGEEVTITHLGGEPDNPLSLILLDSNHAPTVDDYDITFDNGDENFFFTPSYFKLNFNDIDGDLPDLVKIVSLPTNGTLKYNDIEITTGFIFSISNSSNLEYIRIDNDYEDTFIFQTSDNNINKLFSNMATFTITVDGQINQPPAAVGNGSTTTDYGVTKVFTRAMFTTATTPPYNDPEGDAAATLKILSLPVTGTLKVNGVNVTVGQEIDFTSQIDTGLFTFVPDNGVTTTYTPSFNFSIADAGSGVFVS